MSNLVKCNGCRAIYHFDDKSWKSFICEICKTFIHNEDKKRD